MTDTSSDLGDEHSLRFGIVCRSMIFPSWQARCIESLLTTEKVKLTLLVIDDTRRSHDRLQKQANSIPRGSTLWKLYEKYVLARSSRSTVPIDLTSSLGNVPVVHYGAGQDNVVPKWSIASELNKIRKDELDFLLHFTDGPIPNEILSMPHYGVWSFQHGDPDKFRGEPSGFWEILKGDPVTGAVLQRCIEGSGTGVILRRGYFKTVAYSYARSRDSVLFGSADWPRQICRDIHRGRVEYLTGRPPVKQVPECRFPTNVEMLRFGWISARAWIRSNIQWLFRQQQWNVGIIDSPIYQVANLTDESGVVSDTMPRDVRWLPEVKGAFMADPFAVAKHNSDGLTILAEEYPWAKARGRIAILNSPDGRTFEYPRSVIELSCHMSYPFLFEHENAIYCIPETHEAREISLFRADNALQSWSKVATLVQGFSAVDSTVFRHEGRWWLLCTSQDSGPNSTLFAWHADELTGPWTPHCANPLKTDIRSSRPAGTPFIHNEQLYRPAQDCSTGYGAAVVINRILTLTPENFSEEVAAILRPDPDGPYPYGLHTVCALQEYTIIDGARPIFVPQLFITLIKNKVHRLLQKIGRGRRRTTFLLPPTAQ